MAQVFPTTLPSNIPWLCFDLVYTAELLMYGFGMSPKQVITPLSDVDTSSHVYSASDETESTWTLGLSINYLWNNNTLNFQ